MLIDLQNIQFQPNHLKLIVRHNQNLGPHFQELVQSGEDCDIKLKMNLTADIQRRFFSSLEKELQMYMNKESDRLLSCDGKMNRVTDNDFDKFCCLERWFKMVCSALHVMYPSEDEWSAYHYVPGGIHMVLLYGGPGDRMLIPKKNEVFTMLETSGDPNSEINENKHKYLFNSNSRAYHWQGIMKSGG